MKRWTSCIRLRFQSTPSTRRVTKIRDDDWVKIVISIHTLHTEGDRRGMDQGEKYYISIHTLHTEGDLYHHRSYSHTHNFNPHPPHGG